MLNLSLTDIETIYKFILDEDVPIFYRYLFYLKFRLLYERSKLLYEKNN